MQWIISVFVIVNVCFWISWYRARNWLVPHVHRMMALVFSGLTLLFAVGLWRYLARVGG